MKHHNLVKKPRPPAQTMFRDRGGSNRIPDRPRTRATLVENKNLYQSSGDHGLSIEHQLSGDEGVDVTVGHLFSTFLLSPVVYYCHLYVKTRTRVASGSAAIIEAMKSSTGGMPFLEGKINDLPPFTFISYEAVAWLLEQVEGITTEREAIDLMQKMLNERLICHSSGNNKLALDISI